ncbi:MAG: hypothetical protein Q4F97_06970 [Bacteroidales bacterium]|nr:hypothetical protein [Bacteroidales bacterium]
MIRQLILFFPLLINCYDSDSTVSDEVEPIDKTFKEYTTSWIGNDGGTQMTHIPHDMLNLYVSNDGLAATVCQWDEGGSNVVVFKNGEILSVPEGSGTGGWGRFSERYVALDKKYTYQLLSQNGCDGANKDNNKNGLPQYPDCNDESLWRTVRRYEINTGKGAPFKNGYGYNGDMLIVCHGEQRKMGGLAITDNDLFVAVSKSNSSMKDSIFIFDKASMTKKNRFALDFMPDDIHADSKGLLWCLSDNKIITVSQKDGSNKNIVISLPKESRSSTFCIDENGQRALIPNCGVDMDILIFKNIYNNPRQDVSFGVKGGVFAKERNFIQGEAGPLRFSGPRGVGIDENGNIYVANQFIGGGRGTSLECYNEKSKKLIWKKEGLIFTATAAFSKTDKNIVYSPEKIHRYENTDKGVRQDKLIGYTLNPFKFKNDERGIKDGAFITSSFTSQINGKDFLFVSDMYGGMIEGYRFDREKEGYIGIPFLNMYNGDPDKDYPIKSWVDRNGNSIKEDNEIENVKEPNQYSMSFCADVNGNIWRGTRNKGFMLWRQKGLNENDIPVYDKCHLFRLPQGITDSKRIWYDTEKDELFLAGFSDKYPDKQDTWWCMGSTIVKLKDFLKRVDSGDTDVQNWKPDMAVYIPFNIEDGSKKDYTNAKAFTVCGDYIFVAIAREGFVTVYDRINGKYIGKLKPGKEVNEQSGWSDFNYTLNVKHNSDDSYSIFNEENAFGKVIKYDIKKFD